MSRILAALVVLLAGPAWAANSRTAITYMPAAGCRNTIPSSFFSLPSTDAATAACISEREGVLAFADAANQGAVTSFRLPAAWDGGNIDTRIVWRTGATSGAVGWCVQIVCSGTGETAAPTFPALSTDNCVSDTAVGDADYANFADDTAVTATGCAASEVAWVRVSRDGAGTVVTDSVAEDADVIGLQVTAGDSAVSIDTIQSGPSPTVSGAGQVGIDTTNDQLLAYGTALAVFEPIRQNCINIANPTSDDYPLMMKVPRNITVSQINCLVIGGTSAIVTVMECDANGANCAGIDGATTITCGVTNTTDDTALSNPTVDANDWARVDVGTVDGAVTQLAVCLTYTVDRT